MSELFQQYNIHIHHEMAQRNGGEEGVEEEDILIYDFGFAIDDCW